MSQSKSGTLHPKRATLKPGDYTPKRIVPRGFVEGENGLDACTLYPETSKLYPGIQREGSVPRGFIQGEDGVDSRVVRPSVTLTSVTSSDSGFLPPLLHLTTSAFLAPPPPHPPLSVSLSNACLSPKV